jgi:hypothetical protein
MRLSCYLQSEYSLNKLLTYICLRATSLRTEPSDRDVRIRSAASRVDLGTRYITVCVLQEGVGGSFQHYYYNRYKIVVYNGLRSDCIKNHASRNESNDSLYDEAHGIIVLC